MKNASERPHKIVVWLIILIMFFPVLATLLYSFSSHWGATILPDGYTVSWYKKLFSDSRFMQAFGRSLIICLLTLIISLLVMIPLLFSIFYWLPSLKKMMNVLILLPFTIPPVVSSVGLLQLYSNGPLAISGTPWILLATYFTITVPFIYRAIANNFSAIALHDLMDAAKLLGANSWQAFRFVVLPNLKKGVMSSIFLCFSLLFGEFVFANMLVGTAYETLQIYLYNMRQTSGHFTSAIVMAYFLFIFICSWLASRNWLK